MTMDLLIDDDAAAAAILTRLWDTAMPCHAVVVPCRTFA